MPATVELTLEQLIEAIDALTPSETEYLWSMLEHRRQPGALDGSRAAKEAALARILAQGDAPVSDWEEMETEIAMARLVASGGNAEQ